MLNLNIDVCGLLIDTVSCSGHSIAPLRIIVNCSFAPTKHRDIFVDCYVTVACFLVLRSGN